MKLEIKSILTFAILLPALLASSGCTYFMLWRTAKYEHDETKADRYMDEIESERTTRMQGNQNYRDVEINALNNAIGTRADTSHALTLEELREQQEREREERAARE